MQPCPFLDGVAARRDGRGEVTARSICASSPTTAAWRTSWTSTSCEPGCPLLEESGHPLLLVVGREQGVERPPLEQQPLGKPHLQRPFDRLAGDHGHRLAVGGDG